MKPGPCLLLGWIAGVLVTALPWLPPVVPPWLAALALASLPALPGREQWRTLHALVAGALLGLCLGSAAVHHALSERLVACHEGAETPLVARVQSVPQRRPAGERWQTRFAVRVIRAPRQGECPSLVGRTLRLGWYDAPPLARGEFWQLRVRLRRPWGYVNPGGFDYERWLLAGAVAGTGSVRAGFPSRAEARPGPFARWQRRVREALAPLPLRRGAVLLALGSGDDSRIDAALWERLRQTGTIHLLVVSGLHVGLVAGLAWLACGWLARLAAPLWPRGNAVALAASGGVLISGLYVGLVGAEPPALRAWVMATVVLAARALGRRVRPATLLLCAAALVLAMDPLAPHRPGFWLSFGAVTVLFSLFALRTPSVADPPARRRPVAAVQQWAGQFLRSQTALTVGLSPLLALCIGSLSWLSPLANGLLVPPMSLLVIPLAVLGCQLAAVGLPGAEPLLLAADRLLDGCWRLLDGLASAAGQPLLAVASGLRPAAVLATIAALAWLLAQPCRWLLLAGALLWLQPVPAGVPAGSFRLLALDVGQGTAVIVDTARHRLLFDTGARYPGGFDLGSAVVLPALAATGPLRLDRLVLSHEDLDHRGGASAVLHAVRPQAVNASFDAPAPRAGYGRWTDCLPGRRWRWDGVSFAFVNALAHPASGAHNDNDRSCVLLIDGDRRALLAGDATRRVEMRLGRRLGGPVDLLLAPHHGSLTSSSRGFVNRLRPATVFVSAGRSNSYGHPHPRVLARYRAIGADLSVTGRDGALRYESWQVPARQRWRTEQRAYWRAPARSP